MLPIALEETSFYMALKPCMKVIGERVVYSSAKLWVC
jgi:hypothetical protein